jgi:hypothetical protein
MLATIAQTTKARQITGSLRLDEEQRPTNDTGTEDDMVFGSNDATSGGGSPRREHSLSLKSYFMKRIKSSESDRSTFFLDLNKLFKAFLADTDSFWQ